MWCCQQVALIVVSCTLIHSVISNGVCEQMGCACRNNSDGITIDCSHSFFEKIPDSEATPGEYEHVTVLTAKGNWLDLSKIENIENLRYFPNIREIDFADNDPPNEYVTIPNDLFAELGLVNLVTFDLSACHIIDIEPEAFSGLPALSNIDLSRNDLLYVPEALSSLPNLTELILYGNSISELDDTSFYSLSNLVHVNLSSNDIVSITVDAFTAVAASIQEILIANNSITHLPSNLFNGLTSLTRLDLSGNKIAWLPDGIFLGTSIEVINLEKNAINWNNSATPFGGLEESLAFLDISSIKSPEFPISVLQNFKQLRRINARNMSIAYIQDSAFSGLPEKIYVDLSNNRISDMSDSVMEDAPRNLHLDLNNNYLTNVSSIFSLPPCWATEIKFGSNSVNCDCDLFKAVRSKAFRNIWGECLNDLGEPITFQDMSGIYLTETCQDSISLVTCNGVVTSTDILPVSSASTYLWWRITSARVLHIFVYIRIVCFVI